MSYAMSLLKNQTEGKRSIKEIKLELEKQFGPIDVSENTFRTRIESEGARYNNAKRYEPSINLPCRINSRYETTEKLI